MIALIQRLVARRKLNLAPIPSADFVAQSSVAAPAALVLAAAELATIDLARGMQLWSDPDAYRDYLCHFARSYGDAVDLMEASVALGDRAAAARLAHKLAGVAGNLALPDTHHLAQQAERVLLEAGDPAAALAQLRVALVQALAKIAAFAVHQAAQTDVPAATGSVDLARLLSELLMALDGDDPQPVEPLLALLAQHLPRRQLEPIERCVRGFDFRGAEARALELAGELGTSVEPRSCSPD
jgi:HPt (histidine-containing phosphotransfer) domain-containing protein